MRLKNISGKKLTDIYVHLYRNHLGLYNHPKDWSPFKMETENGSAVHIKSLEPDPSYSDICTYEKYLQWINKPNVAARNVSVRPRSTVLQEQKVPIKGLGRPSSTLMGFYVRVLECHSEARYGICQKDLLIDEENVCFKSGSYIFHVATVPSTFEGQLLIWSESSGDSPLVLDITLWDLIMSPCGGALEKYYVNLEEHLNDIPFMTAVTRATDQANTIPITVQGTLLGGCHLIYQ